MVHSTPLLLVAVQVSPVQLTLEPSLQLALQVALITAGTFQTIPARTTRTTKRITTLRALAIGTSLVGYAVRHDDARLVAAEQQRRPGVDWDVDRLGQRRRATDRSSFSLSVSSEDPL